MDYGESQGIPDLNLVSVPGTPGAGRNRRIMKKRIAAVLSAFVMMFILASGTAYASGTDASGQETGDVIAQVKQQLSEVLENVDQETAGEAFSFLRGIVQKGDLTTDEGLSKAVEEGKEKFGVEISKKDAKALVDAMEKLEDLGFSSEYLIDKTESLYTEYGAGLVEHMDEIVTGAVKDAASNAVSGFFDNLKNSVKDFFKGLFS